jgi:hypothetical protein
MGYGGVFGPIAAVELGDRGPVECRPFLPGAIRTLSLDPNPWTSAAQWRDACFAMPRRAGFHLAEKGDDLVTLSIRW